MNILVIGGGPGGLFTAIAALRADPGHRVTVLERRPEHSTYGFGIAVATAAVQHDDLLHKVGLVDPDTADELRRSAVTWGDQHVAVPGARPVHLSGSGYCFGRQRLIDVLTLRARALGADVRFGEEVPDLSLAEGSDLVVLADGAGSRLRRQRAQAFGTVETPIRNVHVWLGAGTALDEFTYAFERTRAGWVWFYGYRYTAEASTVIVECAPGTWTGMGWDTAGEDVVLAELSELFAAHLGGTRLESRPDGGEGLAWQHFPTITNLRWSDGNVVLLGDSAHTAHYSIGSGTTLAMDDAAALGAVLRGRAPVDLPVALRRYEAARRPEVERLQAGAARSLSWFEDVDRHLELPPLDVGFSLAMRRDPGHDGRGSARSSLRYAMHLSTQWRAGREARRALAAARRAVRQLRPAARRPEAQPTAR